MVTVMLDIGWMLHDVAACEVLSLDWLYTNHHINGQMPELELSNC